MRHHEKRGKAVKIANGPWKGKYFVIADYYTTQYQGKSIEKLAKVRGAELTPVLNRGFPIDDDVVWGRLYPAMNWCCVHDKELQVDMKMVDSEELPPNVEQIKKRKPRVVKPKALKKEEDNGPPTAS